MINRITLQHFKCFELLKLPLAPLTLLTGLNASGKSTTIQALTLLQQSLPFERKELILNGWLANLGSADEVVDKISGRDRFAIGLADDNGSLSWEMQVEPQALTAPFAMSGTGTTDSLLETIYTTSYISADRIGPQETYPVRSTRSLRTVVGARGEYTPWFINTYEDLEMPDAMCHPGATRPFKRQVGAWLAHFFPGSSMEIEAIERTNLLVMRMRTNGATNFHRMTNVGYGLSHVLPVITAALGAVGLAHRDKRVAPLVLVENPELHLHPAGQSAMGEFLARAAAAGAQVLIETHSDHILNGVRRAVKGVHGPSILRPEQVAIHFFQPRDLTGGRPQVISPVIDQAGNLDAWPTDFFDQYAKDLDALIDW